MRVGTYELFEELGRGGAGAVHRARALDGREVALKVLTGPIGQAELASFERERRLLAEFGEAEGFVPLLDAGSKPPFLVMPLLEGGTLRTRLAKGPLAVGEAVALVSQLAKALGRAHERGVVHRDVKPENVLFTHRGAEFGAGRPLIADLGLAKHFRADVLGASQSQALSKTGTVLGTTGYMAPEQLDDSKRVGPAADVFALGVILHEALAGAKPFDASSLVAYGAALARGAPPPLRRLRPDAPPWLEELVRRALSKDTGIRFTDGHALARALEKGGATESRALLLPAIVVAVVLIAGTLAALSMRTTTAPPPPPPRPLAPALPAKPAAPPPPPPSKDLSPELAEARRQAELGQAAVERKDFDEAIACFKRALELAPQNVVGLKKLAGTERLARRYDDALVHANEAVALVPQDGEALRIRALVYWYLKRRPDALADLDRAMALGENDEEIYFLRGTVRHQLGMTDAALADLAHVLDVKPDHIGARISRALVYEPLDLEKAIADYTRALVTDPMLAEALLRRGMLYARSGRIEEARADWIVFTQRHPGHSQIQPFSREIERCRNELELRKSAPDRRPP